MLRQSIQKAVFCLALCGVPATASAEMQVVRWGDRDEWNAVGTINRGGVIALSGCTGTLIAPDLVLTAAHCVPRPNAAPEVLARATFIAGWNRGDYAAFANFAAVYFHPEDAPGRLALNNIHRDAALVRLATPIPANVATPMQLGEMPAADVPLALIGYANRRRHAPEFSYDCAQTEAAPLVMMIDCAVFGGQSGSPLMHLSDDGPRVIGVISAQVPGGAMAAHLQPWMRAHLPDLP